MYSGAEALPTRAISIANASHSLLFYSPAIERGRWIGDHLIPRRVPMLYMIVEQFRGGDPLPVYRRVRDDGRKLPEGLNYVSSWVTADLGRCYQVMETDRPELFKVWFAEWADLVEFELIPVMTSAEARETVAPLL